MWSHLPITSFINPLSAYVENKAGDAERFTLDEIAPRLVRFDRRRVTRAWRRGDLCESAADTHGTALMTNAIAAVQSQATVSGPDDAAGALCGSQREIVSYDNELTVKWRRGFNWKQRS